VVEDTWTVEGDVSREEVDVDEGTAGRTPCSSDALLSSSISSYS
jgi:hypothetical protein